MLLRPVRGTEVTVEAGQLTVLQIGESGRTGAVLGIVPRVDWIVHATVTLQEVLGGVRTLKGGYDFEQQVSYWENPIRNFETKVGFVWPL